MNEADLLQANATVVVGILIFLTISPLTKKLEKDKRAVIIISACVPKVFLIASTGVTLFYEETQLALAKSLFFAGLVAVLGTIIVVLFLDEIFRLSRRVITGQSGPDIGE